MSALEEKLAIQGGMPVRKTVLPYSRQWIEEDDISAVVEVLRSDLLTTGPKVEAFEQSFAEFVGAGDAVAVSNGTAALHAAMYGLSVGPGDEVIVPTMTFAATANSVIFQGATPVFADVDPDTLLLGPEQAKAKITSRTKAIVAVDYAGQPCDYDALQNIADRHGLSIVADACHAAGASYKGRMVGSLATLNTFSFHPVKNLTTGEGGIITTDDAQMALRMRAFRNHCITSDHHQRAEQDGFTYEILDLGHNYRITDIQCALGLSQLRKLPEFVSRRQAIAARYDIAFAEVQAIEPLPVQPDVSHAYHLYVIRLDRPKFEADRAALFAALRAEGIGVNVHYIPVHFHPFYQKRFGCRRGDYPVAEDVYERLISLPIFPSMTEQDIEDVVAAVRKVVQYYAA